VSAVRFNLGAWNTALADAIRNRDLRRVGSLVDAARAAGMNYHDISSAACAASGIDPAEWETLLYAIDSGEAEEVRP